MEVRTEKQRGKLTALSLRNHNEQVQLNPEIDPLHQLVLFYMDKDNKGADRVSAMKAAGSIIYNKSPSEKYVPYEVNKQPYEMTSEERDTLRAELLSNIQEFVNTTAENISIEEENTGE